MPKHDTSSAGERGDDSSEARITTMRTQDSSMPPPPDKKPEEMNKKDQPKRIRTEAAALFIMRVSLIRDEKLIQLTFERNKLIEQLMTEDELEDTGVGSLTDKQKAELNAWLDPDRSRIATMRTQDFSMPPVPEKNRKKNRHEKSRLRSFSGHDKHREA
jgi:hypothetical protein